MITDEMLRTLLSFFSIAISSIALINSIKSSYNPKIKIAPFFDEKSFKIARVCGNDLDLDHLPFPLLIILFVPIIIMLAIRELQISRGVFVHGVRSKYHGIFLQTRFINSSKYPITIYEISLYKYFRSSPDLLSEYDISITFTNKDESVIIEKSSRELIKLPLAIEPFSFVEAYIYLEDTSSIFDKMKYQRRYKKVKLILHTSSRRFIKKIKVYNGFYFNKKNLHISFDAEKSKLSRRTRK